MYILIFNKLKKGTPHNTEFSMWIFRHCVYVARERILCCGEKGWFTLKIPFKLRIGFSLPSLSFCAVKIILKAQLDVISLWDVENFMCRGCQSRCCLNTKFRNPV